MPDLSLPLSAACAAIPYGLQLLECPAGSQPDPVRTPAERLSMPFPPHLFITTALGVGVVVRRLVQEAQAWRAAHPGAVQPPAFAAPAPQVESLHTLAMEKIIASTAHKSPRQFDEITARIPPNSRALLVEVHETAYHHHLDNVLP